MSDDDEVPYVGNYEIDVEGSGLDERMTSCSKKSQHLQFIPVENFTMEKLPNSHRNNIVYNFIKALAALTVLIKCSRVSDRRPDFWPNSEIPYCLYNKRGKCSPRTATGFVVSVHRFDEPCPCESCQCSGQHSPFRWEIEVDTATHAVFGDREASTTRLGLFYDTNDSPKVFLNNVHVAKVQVEKDITKLSYVTCDECLGEKLKQIFKDFLSLWDKVYSKYKRIRDDNNLLVIVSHPHGLPKQVSLGRWIDRIQSEGYFTRFTYDTCTCPGSSGATVFPIGYNKAWDFNIHSGVSTDRNFSSIGYIDPLL